MCFLKSSILSMFLILFGTAFHIRLPLKQSDSVPYLEALVSGNFNNCLLRNHIEYFSSRKNLSWLVDVNYLLTCKFQLITYVCYFYEHSTSYLLIVDLRNSHLPFHILGTDYVCLFDLFDLFDLFFDLSDLDELRLFAVRC